MPKPKIKTRKTTMPKERKAKENIKPQTSHLEIKYYGINACQRIYQCRANDIIKVYIEKSLIKRFSNLLKWCAEQKKSYHVVEKEDLNKICASMHHEGICLLTKALPENRFSTFLTQLAKIDKQSPLIYLDGVQNPHNLGSIVRACTHFGVPFILGEETNLPSFSPSCARIAQGGCEVVKLLPLKSPVDNLKLLKKEGFSIVSTSSHKGVDLFKFSFKPRTILAIGGESFGISPKIEEISNTTLLIPGTGEIESLNLSQAAAIFLGEYWRQMHV